MEKSRYVITAVISLILLLMLYLAKTTSDSLGLAYSYDDWHDEEIENAGTVKIPNDWHTEAFDDGVAILDSDGDICMIGLNSGAYKYKDHTCIMRRNGFKRCFVKFRILRREKGANRRSKQKHSVYQLLPLTERQRLNHILRLR